MEAAEDAQRLAGKLLDALEEQVEPWQRLLDVARAKQHALVAGDAAAIERAVTEEERLAGRLQELEAARYRLQQQLAALWGLAPGALTWDELARRLPGRADAVRALRRRLLDAVEALAAVNRENAALARQGLAWARFGLQALAGAGGAVVYQRDGRLQFRPGGRAVDRAF